MRHLLSISILILILVTAASAQWQEDGIPVVTSGTDPDGIVILPVEGGAILVWSDSGTGQDILAQRIDAVGDPLWGPDGVVVCGTTGDQTAPVVVTDGADGCLVFWQDERGADKDIYGHRLGPNGAALWAADGIPIEASTGNQSGPRAAPDGSGGAYITWVDVLVEPAEQSLVAARMDDVGVFVWNDPTKPLALKVGQILDHAIIADEQGGCIVTWNTELPGSTNFMDIFAQKIDSQGQFQWLGNLDFVVDSFFDITYEVEFEGCPGSVLEGYQGMTIGSDSFETTTCTIADDGSGTVDIPVDCGSGYKGTFEIIDGLPPGTTLSGPGYLKTFSVQSVTPGGSLGGDIVLCDFSLEWSPTGEGEPVDGFFRSLAVPGVMEIHTGPQTVQPDGEKTTAMELVNLQAELFGDPDFCVLRIRGGTDQGHPGPGVTTLYPHSPIGVCTNSFAQFSPDLAPDGAGGAFIVWNDGRPGTSGLFAQRVRGTDGLGMGNGDGNEICASGSNSNPPLVATDQEGGAIIGWIDTRTPFEPEVYAQRIDGELNELWNAAGVSLSPSSMKPITMDMVESPDGGVIMAWRDYSSDTGDLFVQGLDDQGNLRWYDGPATACREPHDQEQPVICPDGQGGVHLGWHDPRMSQKRVFAQRVDRFGYWGWPAPEIVSVKDVPGDQGGLVDLAWAASRLDPWPETEIGHYTVWRSITQEKAAALKADLRVEKANDKTIYWQLMETVPAAYLPGYSTTVATLFDSTATDHPMHYFQVMAHASQTQGFWASGPDSSRSVDNLAPAMPKGLAGAGSYQPDRMDLIWDANTEEDLLHYVVHRGLSPGFVPDESTLMTTTPDTIALDGAWDSGTGWHYKVAAVDIHQNVSGYALLVPGEVSGVRGPDLPTVTVLRGNHPNPFNPGTVIRFDLGAATNVRLRVFDVGGRGIRTLVDGTVMKRGRHDAPWGGRDDAGRSVAAGIYFYLLEAGDYSGVGRMMLVK